MIRYAGIEVKKGKNGIVLESKQKERMNKFLKDENLIGTEKEVFEKIFEVVNEKENMVDEFQKKISDVKFIFDDNSFKMFVENPKKIEEKNTFLKKIKKESVIEWKTELLKVGVTEEEFVGLQNKIVAIDKKVNYVYELKSVNKTLSVLSDGEKIEGLLTSSNQLDTYDIHNGIENLDEAMRVLGIENYDECVVKGWKNNQTYDGLHSAVVNNEKEYFEKIKELTKIKLYKANMGIYGYTVKCAPLVELDEWHEMFESDLIDHEMYEDEYENGEPVLYIQPEYFFGDVKIKPQKEEYPCVLVLNTQGIVEEGSKFFWVNL